MAGLRSKRAWHMIARARTGSVDWSIPSPPQSTLLVFKEKMKMRSDSENDNDNDTLREVQHLSDKGLASQARV